MDNDFIKDKWYITTYQQCTFLGKCVKFSNNSLYASEVKIMSYKKYSIEKPYRFTSGYLWTLATQEDLDTHLPKDHPDRSDFIPEYAECIIKLYGLETGKIYPCEDNMVIDGKFNNYSLKDNDGYKFFKPSTKAAYDLQNSTDVNNDLWTPKIGDWITVINDYAYRTTNGKTFIVKEVVHNLVVVDNGHTPNRKLWVSGHTIEARKALDHEIPTEYLKGDTTNNSMEPNKIVLDESHLGRLMSFTWYNKIYDKALFIKENGKYYFLNNLKPNNDNHSDKSVYRHSLKYDTLDALNTVINDIQFLDAQQPKSPQIDYKFNIGDIVKIVKDGWGCSPESVGCHVTILNYVKDPMPAYIISKPEKGSAGTAGDGRCYQQSFELVSSAGSNLPKYFNNTVKIANNKLHIPPLYKPTVLKEFTVNSKIKPLSYTSVIIKPKKVENIIIKSFSLTIK